MENGKVSNVGKSYWDIHKAYYNVHIWFFYVQTRQVSAIKLVQSATSIICLFRMINKSSYRKIEGRARFLGKNQHPTNCIIDPIKLHQSLSNTNGSAFTENRNVKKRTCRARRNIYYCLSIANCRSLFHVTPLESTATCLLRSTRRPGKRKTYAFGERGRDTPDGIPAKCTGKLRVTRSSKLRKLRQRAVATFTRDYQLFGVEARATRRDATRRRASPAGACVASPDAKTAKKPDTPAERNARATVRKAVAVTTNVRLPTGCHEEWQGRVIDSSTIATSWYCTI